MNKPPQVRTVQSKSRILILVGLAVALNVEPGASQADYGNRLGIRESGRAIYYSTAPSLRTDAFVNPDSELNKETTRRLLEKTKPRSDD